MIKMKNIYFIRIQLFQSKARHASNLVVLLVAILINSCGVKKHTTANDDYFILNMIVKESKLQKPDKTLVLDLDNNNQYLSSVLMELNQYESENDIRRADSLKLSLGVDYKASSLIIRDSILNIKQYPYLISQEQEGKWKLNHIDTLYLGKTQNRFKKYLKVSKPIYTNDKKFALVSVSLPTLFGIYVYKKIDDKWINFRMIGVLFTQPSTREFIYEK